MFIGVITLELAISHAMSLKDKRAVLNRLKSKIQNKFNVSIAEIDAHDIWNIAVLGIAILSNEQRYCNQVVDKVMDHIEEMRDFEVEDYSTEYIQV